MKPTAVIGAADVASGVALLFDLDGVLVDVSGSYRKAIQETVRFFSGRKALVSEIQRLKEKGGYNNDWDLTLAILVSRGLAVCRANVVLKFQQYYLGMDGKGGFILNERWLLPKRQLARLRARYRLGIVTGRPRNETFLVLRRFGVEDFFDTVVAMEDYPAEKAKPDPYPIQLALKKLEAVGAIYFGDSVDDIVAAKCAGIRSVGCLPPGVSSAGLRRKLLVCGAEKVLEKISEINSVVC